MTYQTAVSDGIKNRLSMAIAADGGERFLRSFASTIRQVVLDEVAEKVIGGEDATYISKKNIMTTDNSALIRILFRKEQRKKLEAMKHESEVK